MKTILVTGSSGLVGSATARKFHQLGYQIVGLDNDMRSFYFGDASSTKQTREVLIQELSNYMHVDADIRDQQTLEQIFSEYGQYLKAVVHCAAQPSHDWAARDPHLDFEVNAVGTLNLLELTRRFAKEASFIFMSTNKVYGDSPNRIPLEEGELRWNPINMHTRDFGIDESMSIDASTHSLFGVSKTSADLLVQEYGRYFGMNTVSFRGGCLTGPSHAGAELHGFLSYLVKCTVGSKPYRIFGYLGKQVRDNIHSEDLVEAFVRYVESPLPARVYNIGGGQFSNVSVLEAIELIEAISGRKLKWSLDSEHRVGDHKWYVSDISRFMQDYPGWGITRNIPSILEEMVRIEIETDAES